MLKRLLPLAALLAWGCGKGATGGFFGDSTSSAPDAGLPQPKPRPLPGEWPAVQSSVPQVDLEIAPGDQARLDANPLADVMVPVTVTWDGASAAGTVRYRGASTRTLPQHGYKVDLGIGRLDHRNKFELIAEYLDSGKLSEKFAADLLVALGLPVPDTQYVQLSVNGKPNGLYLDMMHVGRDYLSSAAMEMDASIYRCGGRNCEMKIAPAGSYQQDWSVNGALSNASFSDMLALEQLINRSDDADFERGIGQAIDLDAYLGNLAADALISNNLIEDARAFWIHELHRDRWSYVPWDLNNALLLFYRSWSVTDPPIVERDLMAFSVWDPYVQKIWLTRNSDPSYQPTFSVLNTRIWSRPALRTRVLDKIDAALAGPFSQAKALKHSQELWDLVGPLLAQDPYVDAPHAKASLAFLQAYIRGRRAFLAARVPALRRRGSGPLAINEIGVGASGYVELYNRGSAPLPLDGLAITDDLRKPKRQILSGGLTIPPQGFLVLEADGNTAAGPTHLAFTLDSAGGELAVFNGTDVYGPLDAVYFGHRSSAYGRFPDGSSTFKSMSPSPGASNH